MLDRNLALEIVRVTETAALSAVRFVGKGDSVSALSAASDALRNTLGGIEIDGTLVRGFGDKANEVGEKVGSGKGPRVELAVEPIDGENLVAEGLNNAISAIAVAETGTILKLPDLMVDMVVVGPDSVGIIDIGATPYENLKALANAKGMDIDDLTVVNINHGQNEELAEEITQSGACVRAIEGGAISGALSACLDDSGVDIFYGRAGTLNAILIAAGARSLGGELQMRLRYRNDAEKELARKQGIVDKVYSARDIVKGPVMFTASGITYGLFLKGIRTIRRKVYTSSIVIRSESGTIRYVDSIHRRGRKPILDFSVTPNR